MGVIAVWEPAKNVGEGVRVVPGNKDLPGFPKEELALELYYFLSALRLVLGPKNVLDT